MSACRYTFMNRRCQLEPLAIALGLIPVPWGGGLTVSTVGLSSTRRSGTRLAYCLGTPSPPSDYRSTRMSCGGALVVGGGATSTSSSSDHSDIAALCV